MTNSKDLFLDKDIRVGGFYEVAIQVCSSVFAEPIEKYTNFIWTLKNIQGPFDDCYNKVDIEIENHRNDGILMIDEFEIPVATINVRETEPIDTGYNWFDICFYTEAIERVFGKEYQTWIEKPNSPKLLDDFILTTLKNLFEIYPFKLALVGFEVSGQYYFDDLSRDLNFNWTPTKFFVSKSSLNSITEKNKKLMTLID